MIAAMGKVRYILLALLALIVLIAAIGTDFAGEIWYEELKAWGTVLAAAITMGGLAIAAILGGEHVRIPGRRTQRDNPGL